MLRYHATSHCSFVTVTGGRREEDIRAMAPKIRAFLFIFIAFLVTLGPSQKIVRQVRAVFFVVGYPGILVFLPGMGPFTNLPPPKGQTCDRLWSLFIILLLVPEGRSRTQCYRLFI